MSNLKTRMASKPGGSYGRGTVVSLMVLGSLALAPAIAQAGVIASAGPTFPTTVTVGQTGLPASITLENRNTNPNAGDTNTVCNAGEATPPCASPEQGIALVATCKQIASGSCTAAGADPGVFSLSSTGTGEAGTSCAGMTFAIAVIDFTYGTVRFTPQPVGSHVTLPGFGASCVIDFTFDVIKSPTGDQDPAVAGNQTAQATEHTQYAGAFGPGALSNFARGTSNGTTVLPAQATIATVASANVTLGAGGLSDQATISGLVAPVASGAGAGTVDFRLYFFFNDTATTEIYTSSARPLTLNGAQTVATAQSETYTPTVAGSYRWRAFYSGDANNSPVNGPCNAANETTVVSPPGATPPPPPKPPASGVLPETKVCTTPPGPAPAGGEICARGTAAIHGATGCAGTPFKVVVRGTQVERVIFSLDGKIVRTLYKPNSGSLFTLAVNPRKLRTGVHRVIARTSFKRQSATKARSLRVTFSRCAHKAALPAFTG